MRRARIDEVNAGDVLMADGFTCVPVGPVLVEKSDEDGELYFKCADGRHCLHDQLDDDGTLVGLAPA